MNRLAVLFLLALLLLGGAARADVDVDMDLGHGGRWIKSATTPFILHLKNSGTAPVEVSIAVSQGGTLAGKGGELRHRRKVLLGNGAERDETFLVPGPDFNEIIVSLETDPPVTINGGGKRATTGRTTIEFRSQVVNDGRDVEYASRIVGVVGDRRGTLATRLPHATISPTVGFTNAHDQVWALNIDTETLRLAPLALDGIDTLVLVNPGRDVAPTQADAELILDWVATGGRLVVCAGKDAAEFATTPLAAELPASWTGGEQRDYLEIATRLLELPRTEVTTAPGTWLSLKPRTGIPDVRQSIATKSGEPFVVERRLGDGSLMQLAFDAQRLAMMLNNDEHLVAFAALLVPDRVPRPTDPRIPMEEFMEGVGIGAEMAKVLQKGAVKPPPLPLVLLGLLMYVVVVGPLDWIVLKRLKKQRLTTFTFTAAVLGFTVLAYGASLLIFATDAVVNRIVFVDLVDTGVAGRHVVRATDVAGYYSPRGVDQELDFTLPAVLLDKNFPGVNAAGNVGRALPIAVETRQDPLAPLATVSVAFRSQRTVRALLAGPMGQSVEIDWPDRASAPRITNGLPMPLRSGYVVTDLRTAGQPTCFRIGALEPGATATSQPVAATRVPGRDMLTHRQLLPDPDRDSVEGFVALLTLARWHQANSPGSGSIALGRSQLTTLAKAGIDRSSSVAPGRALFVGFAEEAPFPLPGDDAEGDAYVLIRKEIREP